MGEPIRFTVQFFSFAVECSPEDIASPRAHSPPSNPVAYDDVVCHFRRNRVTGPSSSAMPEATFTATQAEVVRIGEIGELRIADAPFVPVAATKTRITACGRLMADDNSRSGKMEMERPRSHAGKPGTKGKLIDIHGSARWDGWEVRIMSGANSSLVAGGYHQNGCCEPSQLRKPTEHFKY